MNTQQFFEKIKQNPKVTIISIVSFLIILILIIILAASSNKSSNDSKRNEKNNYYDYEYFQHSILMQIRAKRPQLETQIKVYNITEENGIPKKELMNVLKEQFNFKFSIGKQNLEYYEAGKKIWTYDILYKDLYEVYQINNDSKSCDSYGLDTGKAWFYFYLNNWMPKNILDHRQLYVMLSPNYLLYYIIDDGYRGYTVEAKCGKAEGKKNDNDGLVKCEFVNGTAKVEYYFEEKDFKTMYPKTISVFKKSKTKDSWIHYREIEYTSFEIQSDESKFINSNLPIGLGCIRKNKEDYYEYYKLKSPFKSSFFFDYKFNFKYFDKKTKKIMTKKHSGNIYHDKITSDLEENVNNGADEETGQPMNTFYDKELRIFYDYYPGKDGKCERHSYDGESNKINWFYFQDVFVNNRDIFDFAKNPQKIDYSYLGAYKVDGIESNVYESILGDFDKIAKERYEMAYQRDRSKNLNNVSSDHMIATYYYHANEKDLFLYTKNLTMPFKIEFRLKGHEELDRDMITLDITNYLKTISNPNEIFDQFKNCLDKSLGYNQFKITYTADTKELDKTSNKEKQIVDGLRKWIDIFIYELRINDFKVEIEKSTEEKEKSIIYAYFKLYDPVDVEMHFNITEGEEFIYSDSDDKQIFKTMNEKKCSLECITIENCGSYSFDRTSLTCKLYEIKAFNDVLKINKGKIDFSKYYKTEKKKDSTLGQKSAFFYTEKHRANLDLVGDMGKQYSEGLLDIYLFQNDYNFYKIKANGLSSERKEGDSR